MAHRRPGAGLVAVALVLARRFASGTDQGEEQRELKAGQVWPWYGGRHLVRGVVDARGLGGALPLLPARDSCLEPSTVRRLTFGRLGIPARLGLRASRGLGALKLLGEPPVALLGELHALGIPGGVPLGFRLPRRPASLLGARGPAHGAARRKGATRYTGTSIAVTLVSSTQMVSPTINGRCPTFGPMG